MRVVSAVVETLVWWGPLVGVWDLTLSGTTVPEIVTAAAAALVSAIAATAARRVVEGAWQPRMRWLRWVGPLAVSVLADTGRVLLLAVRHGRRRGVPSRVVDVGLEAQRRGATADAHRALATLTLSATPGTLVVDADPEEHGLVVHSIVEGRPRLQEVVSS